MKRVRSNGFVLFAIGLVLLTGTGACVPFWKKNAPLATATNGGLPARESWCYRTMGEVDCYPAPQQDLPADRLVSVDPPSRFPLTEDAYKRALADAQTLDSGRKGR